MADMPKEHKHISEREPDGSFEDCTWDSGLEWYRLVFDDSVPATHAEAQRLRADSGEPPTGGSNLGDLAKGIKVRYSETIPARQSGADNLIGDLKPGMTAVVQGSMSAFGPGHRLSKWDRNFDGGHATQVSNIDGVLLWCDPEAPKDANVPVPITKAELRQFVNAFPGEYVIAPIKSLIPPPPKEDLVALTKYLPGYTAKVKKGSNVRSTPQIKGALLHKTEAAMPVDIIGTVEGDKDPGNGSTVWYAIWHEKREEYTATDNIVSLTPPASGVADCSVQEAEVARLNDVVATQSVIISEQATALASSNASLQKTYANIDALKG